MGKGQSKHGQCYVVNAHFNPLCQLEESGSLHSIETPPASQDSGLQLTPELSFTLSEDNKSGSEKDFTTKCALEVYLPQESLNAAIKNTTMDIKPEKADGEKSEQQITLECVQNNHLQEKQEFSFVLRNYSGEETQKDDVEKVVVRSICEALKSSLKLPPSGARTLKVHLTVSPDSEKESLKTQDKVGEKINFHDESPYVDLKPATFIAKNECREKKNMDFPSPTTMYSPAKHSDTYAKCCQRDGFSKFVQCSALDAKAESMPSPHTKRSRMPTPRKETRKWMTANEFGGQGSTHMNVPLSPHHSEIRQGRHHHHVRHQTTRDCNHYLDLAGSESADVKQSAARTNKCDPRYSNPAYYSPHHLDKTHASYRSFSQNPDFPDYHNNPKKSSLNFHRKLQDPEIHSHILKYKLLREAKSNLLDLSFDLCDLGGKHDEPHQHRRSKSYDTNECFLDSPKTRHRNYASATCSVSPFPQGIGPPSPSRHHRHRHREREKDKQRALQQVASWLEREDLDEAKLKQNCSWKDSEVRSTKDNVVERHEYHHIHEHHHYYHYVDS